MIRGENQGVPIARSSHAGSVVVAVFAVLLLIYIPTSSLRLPNSIDPQTNALTAYLIAETGSPIAHGFERAVPDGGRDRSLWLINSNQGLVSKYPPGAAWLAVPAYVVAGVDTMPVTIYPFGLGSAEVVLLPEMWPAAVVASVATAAAMALFAGALVELDLQRRYAIASGIVVGLATSMWSVAANALWQHGPAAMFIALALFLVARDSLWLAGLACALAILVRPQTAIPVAILGIWLGISRHSIAPTVRLAVTSALGAISYLAYNLALFGSFIPDAAGAYALRQDIGLGARLDAIVSTLFDINRGLLVHSPVLIVAIVAVGSRARKMQSWTMGAALGGLVYILFQARPGDFAGAPGFWSYRYPLEGLMFAAPLLAMATADWIAGERLRQIIAAIAIAGSVALHGFGTIALDL